MCNMYMAWDASEQRVSHGHEDFVMHKRRVQLLLRSRDALDHATLDLEQAVETHYCPSIAETAFAAAASPPLDLCCQLDCHSSTLSR